MEKLQSHKINTYTDNVGSSLLRLGFISLTIFFLLYLLSSPQNVYAGQDNFCESKTRCYKDGEGHYTDCDTFPADKNTWYGAFCENGTFNPYCVGGSEWKFYYPTCQQINYPCTRYDTNCDAPFAECSWATHNCSTADSCPVPQPKLYPGQCVKSAYDNIDPSKVCQVGSTVYKVCCASNGQLGGNCIGGNFNGSCPTGTNAVMCGVSASTCGAVYPYPCSTASCDASACPKPAKCVLVGNQPGQCCDNQKKESIPVYEWDDGNGPCEPAPQDLVATTCSYDAPGECLPTITITPTISQPPTPPPGLLCGTQYANGNPCGCKPGTGCKDGINLDYSCCHRECSNAQCITLPNPAGTPYPNKCDLGDPQGLCSPTIKGVCTNQGIDSAYKVTGTCPAGAICTTYAKYTSGSHAGEFAWQGERVPMTHFVFTNEGFDWYTRISFNGNVKDTKQGSASCGGGNCCVSDDDCGSSYQCIDSETGKCSGQ